MLSSALHLLQAVCALFLIIVTPWKMFQGDGFTFDDATTVISNPNATLENTTTCLLDPGKDSKFLSGSAFCIAVMVFGVATLVFGALVSCAKCLCKCATANVCGVAGVVTIVADLALAVAWGFAFVLLFSRGRKANDAGFPERAWRDATIGAAFVGAASYLLDAIVVCCTVGKSS